MPNIVEIYTENNDFQLFETLKRNRQKRSKTKSFFVEGVNSINLLLENNWEIESFVYSKENEKSDWLKNILKKSTAKSHFELPNNLLEKLSDKENTSELIAIVKMKEDNISRIDIKKDLSVLVIDRASNPGNLGTIIRSSNSFGINAIILTGHSVDLYDLKTINSSVGTIFSIPIIRLESHREVSDFLNICRGKIGDVNVIGTSAKADYELGNLKIDKPLFLLIGNETYGLSDNYKNMCSKLVKIPINGSASSLNVACATSIFLYEIGKK